MYKSDQDGALDSGNPNKTLCEPALDRKRMAAQNYCLDS